MLRLGQPWVNLPQASDSLDAIAALFRVSSGVGLCAARLGDDDRASRRANARARVHRRAHRFKRIRTCFLSFVFVSC